MNRLLIAAAAVLATACGKELKPDAPPDCAELSPEDARCPLPVDEAFTHVSPGNGVTETLVDASSETEWHYLDLGRLRTPSPETPEDSPDWDLAFQRFKVKSNGGISGTGGVEVAILPGASFDEVVEAPGSGWVTDREDGDDTDNVPDYAFSQQHVGSETGWYTYDPINHRLAPADVVYVVKAVNGEFFKVQMTAYYSAAGSPGYPAFRWARVRAPSGIEPGVFFVEADTGWVHIRLPRGSEVAPTDFNTSTAWDLAMSQAAISTNSGAARAGIGGARQAPEGLAWDDVTTSPTTGFVTDRQIPFPGAPGAGRFEGNPVLSDWFVYDAANHTATSKGLIYLVRTATGSYTKLQITGFDSEASRYSIRTGALTRDVRVERTEVDASDEAEWVYLDFEAGAIVEVEDPLGDRAWDLALSGTRLKTNGGTSGGGGAGAALAPSASLDGVTSAAGAVFLEDGASGNAVLDTWYEFSAATGTTARDAAFLLRTAEEGYVKLKIGDYREGRFTLDWAYAGAGHEDF